MDLQPFSVHKDKPWGSEIVFTPQDLDRAGKIIYVDAGKKLSLQYHDKKQETILLFKGEGLLWLGDTEESVEPYAMELLKGYTIQPGMVHRLQAETDCVFFEVSSPEIGITYRLEDDYHRDDEHLS